MRDRFSSLSSVTAVVTGQFITQLYGHIYIWQQRLIYLVNKNAVLDLFIKELNDDVIFFSGLAGTNKSSWVWSSAGKKFPCLNKDLGCTHRRLTFTCLLFPGKTIFEVGELLWRLLTRSTEVPLILIFRCLFRFFLCCFTYRCAMCSQLQKQTDPAKTGLARYLVSKSHRSEACHCRVQRFFSLSRQDLDGSFATKRKLSGS